MKTKIQIKTALGKILFEFEKENNSIKSTLEEAVRKGADLRGAHLEEAYLREANLIGANLRGANLEGANLREANLRGAYLREAYLREAHLIGANLRGANLREAHLIGAYLEGVKNYYSFVAYDTSKRIVHCIKTKGTWMVKAGCFWGTLEELEKKVKETHESKVYLANIELLKTI